MIKTTIIDETAKGHVEAKGVVRAHADATTWLDTGEAVPGVKGLAAKSYQADSNLDWIQGGNANFWTSNRDQ